MQPRIRFYSPRPLCGLGKLRQGEGQFYSCPMGKKPQAAAVFVPQAKPKLNVTSWTCREFTQDVRSGEKQGGKELVLQPRTPIPTLTLSLSPPRVNPPTRPLQQQPRGGFFSPLAQQHHLSARRGERNQ